MPLFGKREKTPLGLYVHIPFCRSKCEYCDFYSLASKDDTLMDDFQKAICAHIRETGHLAPGYRVDTVYFGGGTPSFFGGDGLSTMLTAIRRSFDVSDNAEITFEANPDSVSDKLLSRLRAEGFNRVSLGVQSDDNQILTKLGRPHDYAQVVSAVERIRKAGFSDLSLDLMYGLPDQTQQAWVKTLEHVLKLKPEHISCYGLKVEPGTPLARYWELANLPDDDAQADMYLAAVAILKQKGYQQYEISNFARKGHASRHNLKYWNGGEYIGFGPDASSDFAGKRFSAIRDLRGYIKGIQNGGVVMREIQEVPPKERAGEYLMLRLRTTAGIDAEEYQRRFLLPFQPLEGYLHKCQERGLAVKDGSRWHLTPAGFLLSNTVISDLLLLQERSPALRRPDERGLHG